MPREKRIVWAEVGDDLVGILPCGLTVAVLFISGGPSLAGYKIRFGAAQHSETFWTLTNAKRAALRLAQHTLQQCLESLATELAEADRDSRREEQ